MRINNQQQNSFKGLNAPLGMFYNPNATIPTLAIETGVTLGRANQANKRGGKQEATERLVEQGVSALVWIYGVQILKKIGDAFGKKVLNIKDFDFDIGRDFLRNPVLNNAIDKKSVAFKVGNTLGATAVATFFIGFLLPKINHKISKIVTDKEKNKKQNIQTLNAPNLNQFKTMTNRKELSFTSLLDKGIALTHTLENNQTARLLITDTGVVAGRFHNSRNKYEKIESLFRDISSIYFYLFSTNHIVGLLNKITNNTDINPKVSDCVSEYLISKIKAKKPNNKIDEVNVSRLALGEVGEMNSRKIIKLFEDKKVISVDDFIKAFPKFEDKAKQMATLQPIFDGNGVLTKTQAMDILSKGWMTEPEFLKKAMQEGTNNAALNPKRYVSAKKLEQIRQSITNFVNQIQNAAHKENCVIDEKFVRKIAKQNKIMNLGFNIFGTAVSIFALAYLIPKVQYSITKKLTNQDKFPGANE